MNYFKSILPAAALVLGLITSTSSVNALDLAQAPLITLKTAPGLVMINFGRDLPLSKAAYNDVNDLDGDGKPDFFFKPAFKYEGYFAYDRCYEYGSGVFKPVSIGDVNIPDANDTSKNFYKCPGKWSGNFLNWVTMSRIDALRKVLYGGKRSTDTATATVLERSYIPQDATIWGKDYANSDNDGYKITEYTPLKEPATGRRHMFANVTKLDGNPLYTISSSLNPPQLVVYQNRTGGLWDLIATERRILGTTPTGDAGGNDMQGPFIVRIETCKPIGTPAKYEEFCTPYVSGATTTYKPTGLLQRYGENKTLAFGLLSGSYDKNYSGGVLRQNIDDFSREVTPGTGIFTSVKGIVYHLNELRPWGFGTSSSLWDCGFKFDTQRSEGSCGMWGNPLGEMMYETLRYFSGASAGTTAYTTGVGLDHKADNGNDIQSPEPASGGKLNLQRPTWINPYEASSARTSTKAYPSCAKPIQMVIGDPKTSFDSDQLPGAYTDFKASGFTDTFGTLNVANEADAIWASEASQPGSGIGGTKQFFIGQVGTLKDGNPSAKDVTTFSNIRGHGPDATTNQGSFYGASVARYGKFTGVTNPRLTGALRVDQISIALDSAIPQIKVPLNGKIISIIPLSKSIGSCAPMTATQHAKEGWQPTGEITSFFIEKVANTNTSNTDASVNAGKPYYAYNISYADNDQGSDNEKDAVVRYVIQETASNQLSIGLEILSEATCMTMHQGYVISGTTIDGVYLDVGGRSGNKTNIGYFLDTPKNKSPGTAEATGTGPLFTNIPATLTRSTIADPRTFSTGTAIGGFVPHDMLWYAAKYGSVAQDKNGDFIDYKLDPKTGDPKNYYFANNPSKLASQIGAAFQNAASISNVTATAAVSSGVKVSGGSLVYQAVFNTTDWAGDLRASPINADGSVANENPKWTLRQTQPLPTARNVVLSQATEAAPTANTGSINANSWGSLDAGTQATFVDNAIFKYLLGDRTNEEGSNKSGFLRKRSSPVGDFINSDPLYVGQFNFGYSGTDYASFRADSKPNLIGLGSNDGFYRLIAADTGKEELAFIPKTISGQMAKLADPAYVHQYYVDGPSAFGHVKFSDSKWKAVLASSLGAGGKAVFAFNASATDIGSTANGVLWEVAGSNSGDGAYLGNVLNKPIVAQLNSTASEPAVIFGNGTNSYNNKASLIVLNAETGKFIRKCEPTKSANTIGNGMTSIAQVSYAEDGKVDLVYAGDYKGNIWRINPKVDTCGTDAALVFTAKDVTGKAQPITAELSVKKAPIPKTGYMVLFGTGQYSTASDPANKDVQTLYGVWDENVTTPTAGTIDATRTNLVGYSFGSYVAATNTRGSTVQGDTAVNSGKTWLDTAGKKGWMLDLSCAGCATGERFLDKPLINGAITYYLSHVPSDDACQPSGNGWVTAIDTNTGVFAKGFKDSETSNSAFVPGAAPRGLFIATTTGSGSSPSAEYLDVGVNNGGGGGPTSNPNPGSNGTPGGLFSDGGGKHCVGSDCIGLGQGNITQAPFNSRQVWRQIQ